MNIHNVAVDDMIPLVSIIIPTRNRAELLRRAIGSVLEQTWKGCLEIIVISDGSEDQTEEIIKSIKCDYLRLLKHETARGASAARNTGLRSCKGKYIAFLDDDDEWTANKLDIQMPVIEKSVSQVGLVYAWMEYIQDGQSVGLRTPKLRGNVFTEMLDKQAIGGCPTIIIKREVIDTVGYFDLEMTRVPKGMRRFACSSETACCHN